MTQQTIELHVNPSDETIRLGPLGVRFLITGDKSNGSVAAFELTVPGAQRLAAPAHSHEHYEETIYGIDGVSIWTVVAPCVAANSKLVASLAARPKAMTVCPRGMAIV